MQQLNNISTGLEVLAGFATLAAGYAMLKAFTASQRPSKLSADDKRQKLQQAATSIHRRFPSVPLMTVAAARNLLEQQPDKYVLVDVRSIEEQEVSMVPGSRVLTKADYEQQKDTHKDATAICLCTVGLRSSIYAQELISQGISAANLQGGILAWTQDGFPLVDGSVAQQPTNVVHTYAACWTLQGEGYQPVFYRHSNFIMVRDTVLGVVQGLWSKLSFIYHQPNV